MTLGILVSPRILWLPPWRYRTRCVLIAKMDTCGLGTLTRDIWIPFARSYRVSKRDDEEILYLQCLCVRNGGAACTISHRQRDLLQTFRKIRRETVALLGCRRTTGIRPSV